ncbi:MAG: lipoprotein [Proteobacteria bacterium]|nr:lipoprotein [Pseudomonadota bacterium]
MKKTLLPLLALVILAGCAGSSCGGCSKSCGDPNKVSLTR